LDNDHINDLQTAVENLHSCQAKHKEQIRVIEQFEGEQVWQGDVHIFDIKGHDKANVCYAWSSPIDGSDKRKFYAVLHIPPVESPADAVRASIARDFKV